MRERTQRKFIRGGARMGAVTFALAIASLATTSAEAQFGSSPGAAPTASGTLRLSAWGAFTEMKPEIGPDSNSYSEGLAVGGDITRRIRPFDLSLEPRFGKSFNATAKERYFLANGKIGKTFYRLRWIHPYGFGGIGYGVVHYPGGAHDNSILYDFGAGLDIDVAPHWAAKADWQYQYWDLGFQTPPFNPSGVTVGVVYNFHFNGYSHRK